MAAGVGIWKIEEDPGTNKEVLEAVKLAWELAGVGEIQEEPACARVPIRTDVASCCAWPWVA